VRIDVPGDPGREVFFYPHEGQPGDAMPVERGRAESRGRHRQGQETAVCRTGAREVLVGLTR
jgi:hypothetical protein